MASTLAWQSASDLAALTAAHRVQDDIDSAGGPSKIDVQTLVDFTLARASEDLREVGGMLAVTVEELLSGELFAGAGGLGMAVDSVFGTTPAWLAEVDAAPSRVLAHHHPDVPNLGDVTKVDWASAPRVRVMSGGFPCQDVSLAGRRRGLKDGTRSGLWSEFAKAIDTLRPDWVVIENVRGLLSAEAHSDVEPCPWCLGDDGEQHALRALGAVLGDLADLGFDAEWTGIRASDVGAPHGRYRVFILAWPSERTPPDSGHGQRRAPRPEPTGSNDASRGSDRGGSRSGDDQELTRAQVFAGDWGDWDLLPTPVGTDSADAARHTVTARNSHTGTSLTDAVRLLPTPAAGLHNDGEAAESREARRQRVKATGVNGNGMGMPLPIAVQLLPTPTVGNATGGNAQRGGDRGDEKLLPGLAREHSTDWGPYAPAVERWESVIGRPAPAPIRHDGKGGKPRLNPELTEWMMGWPAGWVTDPEIDLTRAEELKVCGNGVVPQQGAAALREMLARPGVPALTPAPRQAALA